MNESQELGLDMEGWQYNDGKGLEAVRVRPAGRGTGEEIDSYPHEWDDNPFESNPFFDQFVLYIDPEGTLQLARTDRELNLDGVNYSVRGSHYWQWVTFLWNCGGFQIY